MAELEQSDIVVRNLSDPEALRVSTGFFNDDEDISRLVEALRSITAMDPEALSPPLF